MPNLEKGGTFQTKLTYVMICYGTKNKWENGKVVFQTKLTYVMICY